MYLPDRLKADYTKRIDELITEGRQVLKSFKKEVEWKPLAFGVSEKSIRQRTVTTFDREAFSAWKSKCVNLADHLLPAGSGLSEYLQFTKMGISEADVEFAIGHLKGLLDVLTKDLLTDVGMKIEAEIASDYMGQAEGLLGEGIKGHYDHIPAAVLSAAVLEKALKTLCPQQSPPISLVDGKGKHKMLNGFIEDLKKAGVYNETKAKQLRAWADIRNNAAHGEFDKFEKTDVEAMVKGISVFLADYLR